ncbi:MAG: hypothetical protein P8I93_01905 [Crocinitomicaceae bacterium]|nr:hypothetical protein [Crocinitomicaceae bacterium]
MKPVKQTFKRNSLRIAKNKLSKHRELGTESPFTIIEVAKMLDTLKSKNDTDVSEAVLFSVSLN